MSFFILFYLLVVSNAIPSFLFVGNSFTSVNVIPSILSYLTQQQKPPFTINCVYVTSGAATFQSHSQNTVLTELLQEKWTNVIFQEQSLFLSQMPYQYRARSLPFLLNLATKFNNTDDNGSFITLFETWGYENGNPSFVTGLDDDYLKMQQRLKNGYEESVFLLQSNKFHANIAYVGSAWKIANEYKVDLWQYDNMHPTIHGSYLAACVFFSLFFKVPAVGRFKGIDNKIGILLQDIAWNVSRTNLDY